MNSPESQAPYPDPLVIDRIIDLAVREVLKNDDLLLDYVAWPDIWLDDKPPGLLKEINREHKLVPMKLLGSEQHMESLMTLRNSFKDNMEKMSKFEDGKQGRSDE